jgi:peroxiredoxin
LRSFQQHLNEFRERKVAIVAISVDSMDASQQLCQSKGFSYPFLSDPRAEVIRRYGVLHAAAGEDGKDIARPAEFLVDATGTIRWVNLTENLLVRARPEAVIRAIDSLPSPVSLNLYH